MIGPANRLLRFEQGGFQLRSAAIAEFRGDPGPYREHFGVEPLFGCPETLLIVDEDVLEAPILYSDPGLRRAFEQLAEEALGRLSAGRTMSGRVGQWIMKRMPVRRGMSRGSEERPSEASGSSPSIYKPTVRLYN
ncbi:hypothetical protein ACF3MZ_13915 [Paenibacillaceae bacterium WGS1546]|uniref:hypothetical protein n=1 Tax=Cohnella sp. WGS1546 TaxID=3366810 RepID=UPI00372D859C